MNLTGLVRAEANSAANTEKVSNESLLQNVNVLKGVPKIESFGMDESQQQACGRILTKKLAIVQGPPGTGKTFTSVSAIRVLLDNMAPDEPPLIIAAQTNHALDQLLNHIMEFDDNIVRLGGRCAKEHKNILKRTLFELRANNRVPNGTRGLGRCHNAKGTKIEKIRQALMPLVTSSLLSEEDLLKQGIISEDQRDSLHEEGWEACGEIGGGRVSIGVSACEYFRHNITRTVLTS